MELVKWNEKFATGIAGIDTEHEELIATINSFYSTLSEHSSKGELINILNDIYGTIHAHFMLEERLMERHGYDEYVAHRDDHARLLDEIREITMDFETTSNFDEQLLQKKLNDWFLIHFQTHDSRLHKLEKLITSHKNTDSSVITALHKLKTKFLGKRNK